MNRLEIQVDILRKVICNISNYKKISCMDEDSKQKTFEKLEEVKNDMDQVKSEITIYANRMMRKMSDYEKQIREEAISLCEIAENIKMYIETNNNGMLEKVIQEFNEKYSII